MDNLIPLLIVAVFYLGPALLKHYRSSANKQQDQQGMREPAASDIQAAFHRTKQEPKYAASAPKAESPAPAAHIQQAASVKEEAMPWNGAINQNMLINGIIFAEILQPPRAYRPFGKK